MPPRDMPIEQLLNEEFAHHHLPVHLEQCEPWQRDGWKYRLAVRAELFSRDPGRVIDMCVATGQLKREARSCA
jgi:hypothetical protein